MQGLIYLNWFRIRRVPINTAFTTGNIQLQALLILERKCSGMLVPGYPRLGDHLHILRHPRLHSTGDFTGTDLTTNNFDSTAITAS